MKRMCGRERAGQTDEKKKVRRKVRREEMGN
jgi:hypothetical protein